MTAKQQIEIGNAVLGIELGSTRIKSVLVDEKNEIIACGNFEWENQLVDGIWSYSLTQIWTGVQESYRALKQDVHAQYGCEITKLRAIGISAMQHGYMVFDKDEQLLVPFRTWRNTITKEASEKLTHILNYPIPQRWSIAHLYQAIINEEEHVNEIAYMTTLAGYVHWKLTGKKVTGLNDASGMFPIDLETLKFDRGRIQQFETLNLRKQYSWKLEAILPKILSAGEYAGSLTKEGVKLLDVSGMLHEGIPLCPSEGDGATGMIATNSIMPGVGNISAGTSAFAMIVLEQELSKVYSEIDQVVTPNGHLVAMVHCNNCTTDLNAWTALFREFLKAIGVSIDINEIYGQLYRKALDGDLDCGGLLAYNYYSGEHITDLEEGRPMFVRTPESKFSLANFMRVHLYSALATMKIGMDILMKEENVRVKELVGHGGLFKTEYVGQKIVSDALNIPVRIRKTAAEGGAWGMAVLASYMVYREGENLETFLRKHVFYDEEGSLLLPDEQGVKGYEKFICRYKKGLPIERKAIAYIENLER